MKLENQEVQRNMISRLRRIEGQVRGVEAMVTEERECTEILQQLTAIQSAVRSASLTFIEEYATRCLLDSTGEEDRTRRQELVKNLLALLSKAPV
jgi:CsoR family transcriptional regulator, copper-sensing transcriptional repressor